jgi:hypothetical protein
MQTHLEPMLSLLLLPLSLLSAEPVMVGGAIVVVDRDVESS